MMQIGLFGSDVFTMNLLQAVVLLQPGHDTLSELQRIDATFLNAR